MTKIIKRITLHEYCAIGLMAAGVLFKNFAQLRPNRIERGVAMNFRAALGDQFALIAAFLLLTIIVFILGHSDIWTKITETKTYASVKSLLVTLSMLLLIIGTAISGSDHLVGQAGAARFSVGIGFWLVLSGLVLLMNRAMLDISPWLVLLLVLILVVSLVVAYSNATLTGLSLVRELENKSDKIGNEMIRHMQLALSATFTGLALSLYLAKQAHEHPKRRGAVMSIVNMAQVIPTLTFLGLVMIPLTQLAKTFPFLRTFGISGVGFVPAYIVLTMYSILPMTTNILAGYKSIDTSVLEAAKGIGMTQKQVHSKIQLPLLLPYILSGFGTSLIQTTGNTILAGLVGGGGMGAILFLGLAQSAPDLVLLGALLVVSVAMILKTIIGSLEPVVNKRLGREVTNDRI